MTPQGPYGYARSHRMLEIASIALFLTGNVYLGGRMLAGIGGSVDLLALGACAGLGYLLADLLSGIVHWAGDTIGDANTPLFGKHFVTPFRLHHVDPKAITRHDFIETNGNNCIVSVPVLGMVAILLPEEEGLGFYTAAVVVFSSWFVFCTNQFHKWAHADRAPGFARALQRLGFILSPTHHDIHHSAPHDKYYCITVGWMNPVLTKLRFFRVLEWVVGRVQPSALHIAERSAPVPVPVSPAPPGSAPDTPRASL